ncbi:TetR/AcrR family transcriptional regulator [Sphaerisporangium perillae]|uniref:TetR/AcrR family transcriptional regulator n=1 Tax=Sphaerisporangium perillae TaxID=2935860 RepID=UPI00200CC007|nr:TetR/AcrR family transcriptional regulator [Sphaerisporangium perillae]
MPTPSPNPARRSQQSHDAVLRAAWELASEVGYAGLSIEGIAARAGVGKQTIYRWWPSKGAVLLDALLPQAQARSPFLDTGDIVTDLRNQMTAVAALMADPDLGPQYAALIGEAQQQPDMAKLMAERLIGPIYAAAKHRIVQAQQEGQLATAIPADLVIAQLYGPLYYRFLIIGDPPDAAFVEGLIAAAFAGLGPES